MNVPLSSVPPNVRNAFVATEDRRFYQHNGLDWHGVLRAVARNFSSGGIRQGFSTITMQVAHNSFLQDRYHGRSLRRKLVELRISRLLESRAHEGPDPRALSQRHLPRQRRERHRGGEHRPVRQGREPAHAARRRHCSPDCPRRRRSYTPRRNPTRAVQRRNVVLTPDGRPGIHLEDAGAGRRENAAADLRHRMASVDHAGAERARRGARARGLGASRRAQGRRRQRLHDGGLHAAARSRPHDDQAFRVDHGRDARDLWPRAGRRAGRPRGDGSDERRHPRARAGSAHATRWIQPRVLFEAPARFGVQAVRLRGGAIGGLQDF